MQPLVFPITSRYQPTNRLRTAIVVGLMSIVLVVGCSAAPSATSPAQGAGRSPTPVQPTELSPEPNRLNEAMLPAGTHSTAAFEPAFEFTVSDGWVLSNDLENLVELIPATDVPAQLQIFRGPMPVAVDNDNRPVPDVGPTLLDVLTYVAERPDLDVIQPPTEWEVDGLPGYWMEVASPDEAERVLFLDGQNIYIGGRNRFAVVELPDGSFIQFTIFTFPGTEAYIEAATPIVESFDFDLP